MQINKAGQPNVAIPQQVQAKETEVKDPKKTAASQEEPSVKYEKTPVADNSKANYSAPSSRTNIIAQLKAETEKSHQNLMDMVRNMLSKQGMTFQDALGGKTFNVDAETQAAAQKSIELGGDLSVDAVAGRIVDFAKAVSGGDPQKASAMRDAIEKGFAEAKKIFGGNLPDISNKTHDEIMKRLDAWEKGTETEAVSTETK